MKYKGFNIVMENKNKNCVYRVEDDTIITYFPTFVVACQYCRIVDEQRENHIKFMIDNRWLDTIQYAVNVFSFIIRGKGEMSGESFAEHIRKYAGDGTIRQRIILESIKNHVTTIKATYEGTKYGILENHNNLYYTKND